MKERLWNSLSSALRAGRCVLVLGPEIPVAQGGEAAGESTAALTVTQALARRLAAAMEEEGLRPVGAQLPAVAQQCEDAEEFGEAQLRETAARFYRSASFVPSRAHRILAELPFSLVLTTCHDGLIRQAMVDAVKSPTCERYHLRGDRRDNPEFGAPPGPEAPLVYHLFGESGDRESLVLSQNDLLDFLIALVSENPPLPNRLVGLLKREGMSFLFVGFGIGDWQLRVLLKTLLRKLDLKTKGNAVAAEQLRGLAPSEREDTVMYYQRGARVEVEDGDVEVFLEELRKRFVAEGGYAGPATALGQAARVFISYARADEALAARLFDALGREGFAPWWDRDSLKGGDDWELRIKSDLQATDFVLLLYTPAFCRKTDGYVNAEMNMSIRRARSVRGSFLIPLRTSPIDEALRVHDLDEFNESELRDGSFEQDLRGLVSEMRREFQRRNR